MRALGRSRLRPGLEEIQFVRWDGAQFAARSDEAMRIYVRAMNYTHQTGAQRAITARRHSGNLGFACRAALTPDGTLVGFGYGYTTLPGQWWHDLVRRAISAEEQVWLDNAFELSEMHVLPAAQGVGIGRQLLDSLAGDLAHRAILLSTPDADTRAFRLYRRMGFVDLARDYLFPGDARPFAVLGVKLPLAPPATPPGG
jgi:ribosomal protein S18 acetylase RimI-like enzyme